MTRSLRLLPVLLAGVFVAGCGSAGPTPSVGSGASPASSASSATSPPTSAPTSAAPSAPVASGGPGTGAGDLRPYLPTSVGGHALQLTQFSGSQFLTGGASQEMVDLLKTLGRTPEDMTLTIAADQTRATDLSITAFRVRDIPVNTFLTAYIPLIQTLSPNATVTPGTRAGRAVTIVVPAPNMPTQVLLTSQDILFVVTGSDAAQVDEALTKLP